MIRHEQHIIKGQGFFYNLHGTIIMAGAARAGPLTK